jgi:hypothetical protein
MKEKNYFNVCAWFFEYLLDTSRDCSESPIRISSISAIHFPLLRVKAGFWNNFHHHRQLLKQILALLAAT